MGAAEEKARRKVARMSGSGLRAGESGGSERRTCSAPLEAAGKCCRSGLPSKKGEEGAEGPRGEIGGGPRRNCTTGVYTIRFFKWIQKKAVGHLAACLC